MSVTSLPKVTAQLLAAAGLQSAEPFRILLVGQIGTDGTATAGQHYSDVESLTNAQVYSLFGSASELTNRVLRARKVILGRSPISVIGLDADGAGVAATLDITVAGTATEDGTLTLKVIDANDYTINVDVLETDDADTVAGKIKTAIDALTLLPATSGAVAAGVFTLTANDVGTVANKYTVKATTEVAGITVTAGQFSGGATDPATTTVFDNVQEVRFHAISWPYQNNTTDLEALLDPRLVINNAFLQGVGFIGYDDTEANITAKVNGATPINKQTLVFMGNRQITGESVIVTPADWRVAEFIAIEALRFTDGVPIAKYVTVATANDIIGNLGLASLAYYNIPLEYTDIGDPNLLFSGTAQENLKDDGYTIVGTNSSSTSTIMGEVVTTYKFDAIGNPDVSFKYLNYVRTGYGALEIYFRTLKADNSQARLTEGDLVAFRKIENLKSIEAQYLSIYKRLASSEFVLTQGGPDAEQYFFDNLDIQLDLANGKITSSGKLPVVTQIREFNIAFQIAFTISA